MSTSTLAPPAGQPATKLPSTIGRPGAARFGPPLVVAATVLFNYWFLRAETLLVAYLNDSSVHAQMVRFATRRLQEGHLPQTSWFPYLGLGSPQFLHYQSLPATVTGLVGTAVGPSRAFTWSLFLLVSLWPIPVYLGARAFRLSLWTAATAALLSAFVTSAVGIGFESNAYLWTGFGVWAQLWAMLTLPLAWAYGWRAISEGRRYFPAVLFVALTVICHFETGYLALVPLALFPFLAPSQLRARLARAAVVAVGSLLAAAWAIVPLLVYAKWASVNEVLRGTPLENGYGAKQVLAWLFTGGLLDAGRLPLITVLAGVGLVTCLRRWRHDESSRALVVLLAMSLVLSFGRTTFGSLVRLLPGSSDIFMRRFMEGVQLAALLLAGIGAVTLARLVGGLVRRRWPRLDPAARPAARWQPSAVAGLVLVVVAALAPAWVPVLAHDDHNTRAITWQRQADSTEGRRIAPLLDRVLQAGDGRVYAGAPTNWGTDFRVGAVPVFKYLESQDVDEVGYTLRTASLMTDPEYFFDPDDPGDYAVFGVRYLLLPTGMQPPVAATRLMTRGPYALWEIPSVGYVAVDRVVGSLTADRSDIGVRSVPYLRSSLPWRDEALVVNYAGARSPVRPSPASGGAPVGRVTTSRVDLAAGRAAADVTLRRRAVVVLAASFDPGWQVTVDGRPATPVMVAPAVVGVSVAPGHHRVVFRYVGFGGYPVLLALGVLTLLVVWRLDRRRSRRAA